MHSLGVSGLSERVCVCRNFKNKCTAKNNNTIKTDERFGDASTFPLQQNDFRSAAHFVTLKRFFFFFLSFFQIKLTVFMKHIPRHSG